MFRKSWLGLALCFVLLGSGTAFGQMFSIDLDASTPAVDKTLTVSANDPITAALVVTGVEDLLGVSADILFDATGVLDLIDIQAVFGDLDFSSIVSFQEITDLISFYLQETAVDEFVDKQGNQSGILIDKNRDNVFGFTEIVAAISQYVEGEAGTQFWTLELANDPARTSHANESVPVFDPVAKSLVGGDHPGLIEDITAVLLRRPETAEGGTTAAGFGYDTSVYGNAIICLLKFEVKDTPTLGQSVISFGKSVMIDENFSNIDTDIITVPNESSTLNVQ